MSHKLQSNQSVTYNSETQTSGVLEIFANKISYKGDAGIDPNVLLTLPVRVSESLEIITTLNYEISSTDWSDFFSSSVSTLAPNTGDYDETVETALHYARTEIDGKWGLNTNDWTFIASSASE